MWYLAQLDAVKAYYFLEQMHLWEPNGGEFIFEGVMMENLLNNSTFLGLLDVSKQR